MTGGRRPRPESRRSSPHDPRERQAERRAASCASSSAIRARNSSSSRLIRSSRIELVNGSSRSSATNTRTTTNPNTARVYQPSRSGDWRGPIDRASPNRANHAMAGAMTRPPMSPKSGYSEKGDCPLYRNNGDPMRNFCIGVALSAVALAGQSRRPRLRSRADASELRRGRLFHCGGHAEGRDASACSTSPRTDGASRWRCGRLRTTRRPIIAASAIPPTSPPTLVDLLVIDTQTAAPPSGRSRS